MNLTNELAVAELSWGKQASFHPRCHWTLHWTKEVNESIVRACMCVNYLHLSYQPFYIVTPLGEKDETLSGEG